MDYPDCPWDDARPSGRRPGHFVSAKQRSVPHPGDFFLSPGWETTELHLSTTRGSIASQPVTEFVEFGGPRRHTPDQLIYSCLQFTEPLRCCKSRPKVRTMIERIAILGTGLLGTSLGLALRAAGFKGSIAGWNRSAEGGREALAMGAVDLIASDALALARESDVVVLCVPIYSTLDY